MIKISNSATKPNKRTARAMVETLHQGGTLSHEETSALLLFFCPPRKSFKSVSTPFDWVALAASKGDPRFKAMEWVKVSDHKAYATDGHRVHVAEVHQVDGFYCPASGHKVAELDDHRFPDVMRAVGGYDKNPVVECDVSRSTANGEDFIDLNTPQGVARFNCGYYDAATVGGDFVRRVSVTTQRKGLTAGKLYTKNKFGEAYVMGVTI